MMSNCPSPQRFLSILEKSKCRMIDNGRHWTMCFVKMITPSSAFGSFDESMNSSAFVLIASHDFAAAAACLGPDGSEVGPVSIITSKSQWTLRLCLFIALTYYSRMYRYSYYAYCISRFPPRPEEIKFRKNLSFCRDWKLLIRSLLFWGELMKSVGLKQAGWRLTQDFSNLQCIRGCSIKSFNIVLAFCRWQNAK